MSTEHIKKCNFCYIQGPQGPRGKEGPRGPQGPIGPCGPLSIKRAYLVTYNDGTITEGVNISSGKRIPINRVEIDTDNIITLNKNESTLKFNNIGYYKISIILSASIYPTNPNFDSKNDFISFGLRLVDTDEIYIGSSEWRQNKYASQIVAEGILSINNTDNTFEIINLGKKEFYLNSPDIKDINSKSYFVNSLVTINIEYLGRGI